MFGPLAARPHRALGARGGCTREEHKINNEGKRQPRAPRVADIRTRTWTHAVRGYSVRRLNQRAHARKQLTLCQRVMANCFVNASYEPSMRNGTCPDAIGAFYTGYAWENGNNNAVGDPVACPVGDCWRNDSTLYPFPRYGMSDAWRGNVEFAVNTALNMIV